MTELTPERLDEIEAYVKILTPGPWDVPILIAEIRRCWAELAQARAAAVQWVEYDGTPETLPMQGRRVILEKLIAEDCPVSYLVYSDKDYWCSITRYGLMRVKLLIGDRWAYLPTPPEATNA